MNKINDYEIINKLMNVLVKKISPINTISSVNKILKANLNVQNLNLIVWDNNILMLKDFVQDWNIYVNDEKNQRINSIFNHFSIENGLVYAINENYYNLNYIESEYPEIEQNIYDNNFFVFPLVANGEVIGLMSFETELENFSKNLLFIMNITSKLLSGAIMNYLLNDQMEVSLNFYKAMKDIAKIIESQYELSYIIPLIGEMIDRFMTSHLIYIFIYKDNRYNLVWPNACKEEKVYELLSKINLNTDYIISDNSKIGIFPLTNEDKILGAIVAYSNIDNLLPKDVDYLLQLTRQSGLTIHRANVYAEVLKYATLDALTGLNNRRQLEIRLKQEVANTKRNNTPLCVMMLDVDYFKKVNDTYGHVAGDCVLKQVAGIISKEIREYDIACRYGGEEFFIILPQTNIKEAGFVAQRLRKVIEETKMDIEDAKVDGFSYLKITVSIGVCAYNKDMDVNSFSHCADKALYEAKTTGRNRVIIVQ